MAVRKERRDKVMRKVSFWGGVAIRCLIGVAGVFLAHILVPPIFAQNSPNPNGNVAPFDFADSFYKQNGLNLSLLASSSSGGRVGVDTSGTPCVQTTTRNTSCNIGAFGAPSTLNWVTDSSNTDPTRTSARLLQTTGGFNKDGNLIYYSIFGTVADDTFFDDPDCPTSSDPQFDFRGCGTRANNLANGFRAFIQPKQFKGGQLTFPGPSCNTVDTNTFRAPAPPDIQPTIVTLDCASSSAIAFGPPPGNRRQDNVFDTQPTYFCQNLLGLWILVFTVYTPNAYLQNGQYASAAAQAAISPIALANGTNLDGTAVLERTSEIDSLTRQGFLQQLVMPHVQQKPGAAPRYVV
jgi:hypothetical protein